MENTTTRITTLEEHRKLLRKVFETAQSRVLVVSPFISKSAIDHDRVPDLVSKATRRGVSVDIYTDDALNLDATGSLKPAARDGVASLLRAGANVTVVPGIHNKTLARDNDLIAEGSFNWLSAVRTSGGTHQREERTMLVEGEQAREMINKEKQTLKKKKTYRTAIRVIKFQPPKGAWQVLSVVAITLMSILFFGGAATKWLYFWFFTIGMAPVVIMVLLNKPDSSLEIDTAIVDEHLNDVDDGTSYIPGIRDFDGTYFAENGATGDHLTK